jgi:nucleoside 2-deoxyribosyltransferase
VPDEQGPSVYLAGPDGFTPAGLHWHRQVLIPAVRAAGLHPLSPWGAADSPADPPGSVGSVDPPGSVGSVDPPGSVDDLFVTLAAMPVGPDRRLRYQDLDYETGATNAALIDGSCGVLAILDGPDVDSGTAAEIGYAAKGGLPVVGLRTDSRRTGDNEGVTVNLQVEYFIRLSGGAVHTRLESAIAELAALVRDRRR